MDAVTPSSSNIEEPAVAGAAAANTLKVRAPPEIAALLKSENWREVNLGVALLHAHYGIKVFPFRFVFDDVKKKWDKVPCVKRWQLAKGSNPDPEKDGSATTDATDIRMAWKRYPDAGAGIPCGPNKLTTFDGDRHGKGDGVAAWEALVAGKPMPDHPFNATAGSGEHHHFTEPSQGDRIKKSQSEIADQVDVLGHDAFFVAPGAVRPDGKRYARGGFKLCLMFRADTIPEVPDWLADMARSSQEPQPNGHAKADGAFEEDMNRGGAFDVEPMPTDLAEVEEALENIPADRRKEWLKVGAALHSTRWTCAQVMWDEWSATSSKYDEVGQDKAWRSFGQTYADRPAAIASIIWLAKERPWEREEDGEKAKAVGDQGKEELQEQAKDELPHVEAKQTAPWPTMRPEAYHGLAGELVRAIEPHTESDPVAILIQTLVCFGSVIGRSAHYRVEASKHHTNLFTVMVGATSRGRKGTSWGRVRSFFVNEEGRWHDGRIKSGLSTGEGLIYEVRDEVKKWDEKKQELVIADPGVDDKRLMIIEPEFAKVLAVMSRQGNTLNPVIRDGWDTGDLATMTRTSPLTATGAHISINAHISEHEARARVTETDVANGFVNRFILVCVKRSKELPHGGDELNPAVVMQLCTKVAEAVEYSKVVSQVTMTTATRQLWAASYHRLTADHPGLLGAVIARAEAHVVRLAVLFALLDLSDKIDTIHLKAAIAVWDYAEASAKRIFGDTLGDRVADEILRTLRQVGEAGLTRTAMRDLFGRNQSADRIGSALQLLLANGQARMETKKTGGRGAPIETWFPK